MSNQHNRHNRRPGPRPERVFVQEPAEAIRRIVLAGRCPRASHVYQRQMACVDAALFTRPDYAEFTYLAAAVDRAYGDTP